MGGAALKMALPTLKEGVAKLAGLRIVHFRVPWSVQTQQAMERPFEVAPDCTGEMVPAPSGLFSFIIPKGNGPDGTGTISPGQSGAMDQDVPWPVGFVRVLDM